MNSTPAGQYMTMSNYTYRADGMRVKKVVAGNVTRSYYDGQMPVEEDNNSVVTRNFVGARGIEAISTTQNSATTTKYPLYDTHGNMVATLSNNTAGTSWSVGDERSYDVWGGVRSGAATGGPKGRYVANLGHVQDDESGLIYMRARYYEPGTGRFISEDTSAHGNNWYEYAGNIPTVRMDQSGKYHSTNDFWNYGMLLGFVGGMAAIIAASIPAVDWISAAKKFSFVLNCIVVASIGFAAALGFGSDMSDTFRRSMSILGAGTGLLRALVSMTTALVASEKVASGITFIVIAATTLYSLAVMGALLGTCEGSE